MISLKWLFSMGALLGFGLLFEPVAHADGLSCQDRLIKPGASTYDVRVLCGPPDSEEQRVETRAVRRRVPVPCPKGSSGGCSSFVDDAAEVAVLEWVYDFGTQRFLQFLTFEDGVLVRMRAGGYGHKSN
jgi:hypothetical protein